MGASRMRCLAVYHLRKVKPKVSLLDHHTGHRTTLHARRHLGRRVSEVSGCAKFLHDSWVMSSLLQLLQRRAEAA